MAMRCKPIQAEGTLLLAPPFKYRLPIIKVLLQGGF